MSAEQHIPRPTAAGTPAPNSVVRTPNPFLLFMEIATAAVFIGYMTYLHLLANRLAAGAAGIALGSAVILLLNTTRLRPLLIAGWAGAFGVAAWHFGWGPILVALAAVLGAAIKIGEMLFLSAFRG